MELLYNENLIPIGDYIKKGLTDLFREDEYDTFLECREKAAERAKELKSYFYPVFKLKILTVFYIKREHIGYAVPS